jgi:hypothetical protein
MASSYSTDLKIELMVTGENAGTWGDKTNANLNVIQQAIAGFKSVSIAGGPQTTNLLINNSPDLATSDARNAVIKLTGTITGNQIVTVPTGIEKTYIVQNGTTGAFTVQFIQSGGTGTTFSTTDKGIKILFADGTNINTVDLDTLSGTIATAQIEDLAITSGKLASFAVTSARLASYAVTATRLATNAVTAIKIAQSTITQSKLATGSVGADQLIATTVTPATYTAATITVDADGRITAASSGSGGAGGFIPTQTTAGPASGTYTATPTANRLAVYMFAGGGGGGGGVNCQSGGPGGVGGYGFYNKPIAQPFAQPYAVGGPGNGANWPGAGGAGGNTTIANVGTVNGGSGGNQAGFSSPGSTGAAGNAPGAALVPFRRAFVVGDTFGTGGSGINPNNGPGQGTVGVTGALVVFENTGT